MRTMISLTLAVLVFSAVAANAEGGPKMKMKGMTDAECKIGSAQTNATCTMEQKKGQMQKMEKMQINKSEQMKKGMHQKQMEKSANMEASAKKGSEQGQAMREEHSRKWWKFWGEKDPAE